MPSRILIADDNPAVRGALRQLLAADGHEVLEAADGQDALEQALEARPDLAIMDLAMPVMDGLTASRNISKHIPDLPIVMCTMHWSPGLEIEAQKFGVKKVLSKSDSQVLLATIADLLGPQPPDAVVDEQILTKPDPAILNSALKVSEEKPTAAAEASAENFKKLNS